MPTGLFINLPVADLDRSKKFYTDIGWTLNPAFTDETAGALSVGDNIYVMILNHENYRRFTNKQIADAAATSAVINALSVDTPEGVDSFVDRAVEAGGVEGIAQDYGFMRSRSFADPDGHQWEVFWMDPVAASGDLAAVQEKYPDSGAARL